MKLFVSPHHSLHATHEFPLADGGAVLEQPVRIDNIYAGLCRVTQPYPQEVQDIGASSISRVHPAEYVQFVRDGFAIERSLHPHHDWVIVENIPPRTIRYHSEHFNLRKGLYLTDTFTQILAGTYTAAYWAAQTTANAALAITAGDTCSYALVRPPGHHAYEAQAGGFCFFNNAAIAARQLQQHSNFAKVAILDIDFHHGNGTQEIFYSDPSVFFCSLHGHPDFAYPYVSGLESERGEGAGEGTTLNICLEQGTTITRYLRALETAITQIFEFGPSALILSLGFDTARGDPYGGFDITPDGFQEIGAMLKTVSCPTVIVQEGGYLLDKLADNSEHFFRGFLL